MPELKTVNGKLEIDGRPVLKGWESFTGWFWFALEKADRAFFDIDGGIWFGFIQGTEEEYGYFSEAEIKALGNMAWPIKPQDLPISGRRRKQ
jgi:hypothetical protein